MPTRPPVDAEGRRDLSPFILRYTVSQDGVPFTNDYAAVTNITDVFLREYFTSIFNNTRIATTLDDFIVTYIRAEYRRGEPIVVLYEAMAFFDKDSEVIPTQGDLDILLRPAFLGSSRTMYIQELQELPESNVFSSTTIVVLENTPANVNRAFGEQSNSSNSSVKSNILIGALAGAAAGLLMLGAGLLAYRRRLSSEHGKGQRSYDASTIDETLAVSTVAVPTAPKNRTPDRPVHNVYATPAFASSADSVDSATYTSGGASIAPSYDHEDGFSVSTGYLSHAAGSILDIEAANPKTPTAAEQAPLDESGPKAVGLAAVGAVGGKVNGYQVDSDCSESMASEESETDSSGTDDTSVEDIEAMKIQSDAKVTKSQPVSTGPGEVAESQVDSASAESTNSNDPKMTGGQPIKASAEDASDKEQDGRSSGDMEAKKSKPEGTTEKTGVDEQDNSKTGGSKPTPDKTESTSDSEQEKTCSEDTEVTEIQGNTSIAKATIDETTRKESVIVETVLSTSSESGDESPV